MKLFGRKTGTKKPVNCAAVVAAAGSSTRMAGIDKMFAELDGVPVLGRTLAALEKCRDIDVIVIVTREDLTDRVNELCVEMKLKKVAKIVCGGDTRTRSVMNGVMETAKTAKLIAVHDGARPFVTEKIVSDTVKAAREHLAAAPGVKLKDTVKAVKDGSVVSTPDRETLCAIQTPQIFNADLLKGALQNALNKKLSVTDDCMAVEALGARVYITEGSYRNIKITTPEDLYLGAAILKMAEDGV
jgi:2-C-methyl-D-erythritol 4-phosphate cytidylyltransferase